MMNTAPDISSFQYDKTANGNIASNVNMYRGAVCFHYNIIEMPRHEGVGISINASYNSDIDKSLTRGNLEAPTGVMGLGWRLTFEKIECDKADIGKAPDCRHYRLTSGDNSGYGSPLHLIAEHDGLLYFENEICDYSGIAYDANREIWTITEPNGVQRIYGGEGGLQYAVTCWGRYTEAVCPDASGHRRNPKAWNLREVLSPSGFSVKYEYDYIEQPVVDDDGLTYTKAAYIRTASDSYGNRADFEYEKKVWSSSEYQPREYVDPHRDEPIETADFYQSEYETKYLSRISVSNRCSFLYRVVFEYDLVNYATDPPITGDTVKRVLNSAAMTTKDGTLPPMEFEYNGLEDVNPGALKRVLYPEGGSAGYAYGQIQCLTMSERTQILSNAGFTDDAEVSFGGDYVVVIQRNDGNAVLSIYQWIGRWQKYTPDVSITGIDPATIQVTALDDYALVTATTPDDLRTKYLILTKCRKIKGGWRSSDVQVVHSSSVKTIPGDGWFLLQDTDNDELISYYYDGPAEKWESGEFPDREGEDGYYRWFASCANRVFCFFYDEDGGGSRNILKIYERNGLNRWRVIAETEDSQVTLRGGSEGDCYLAFDGYFAAGAFVSDKTERSVRYTFGLWRFDGDTVLKKGPVEQLSIPVGETSCLTPRIAGNTVITAGYLYRFCGTEWVSDDALAIAVPGNYQFALTEDIAVVSGVMNDTLQIKGTVFDKTTKEWEARILFLGAVPEMPYRGVSISGDIAVCGEMVYDISGHSFDRVIAKLDNRYGSSHLFNNGICLAGSVYEKNREGEYQPRSAYIYTVQNGRVVDRSLDSRVYDKHCGGSGSIFSLGNFSTEIKLLYAGGGFPNEPVTFYQAAEVALDDGINVVSKSYLYDVSAAACDESGQYARYAVVTVMDRKGDRENRTVYRYRDSISSAAGFENITESSVADGTLISMESYLNGKLDNRFDAEYEFTDTVDGRRVFWDVLLRGVLTKVSQMDADGTGVSDVTEFTADTRSGERSEVVTWNYNVSGNAERRRQITTFAYRKYAGMERQHRFTEVAEDILEVNGDIVSKEVRNYGKMNGNFSEISATLVDPSGVRDKKLYEITGRGKFNVITSKNGVFPEYFEFDKTGCYRTGEFTNSGYGECFAYCFEEYEAEERYRPVPGAALTDAVCYAGTRCLEIKPGCRSNPIHHHFPVSGGLYGFSFYAACQAECKLRIAAAGRTAEFTIAAGPFGYRLVSLKEFAFRPGAVADIEFTFVNDSKSSLFVDVISFFPLLNPPRIHVYYLGGVLLAASISGYGDIAEPVYDEKGRTVYIVRNKKMIDASIPSLMRESGDCVNSDLLLKNAGDGQYKKFVAKNEWFTPEIALEKEFAALFFCGGDMEIILGGALRFSRVNDLWTVTGERNAGRREASGAGSLITLVVAEIMILAVNGRVIFVSHTDGKAGSSLRIRGGERIANFVVGNNPVYSIKFSDGAGKFRQEHCSCGSQVSVTAACYDDMGRCRATTIPTYIDSLHYQYDPGFISGIDGITGSMSGTVSKKNPECDGYPYYSTAYESRANGRLVEKGSPCPQYAIRYDVAAEKRHTVRTAYSKNLSAIDVLGDLPPYFTVVTVRDPDGNEMATVYDLQKNEVATAAKIAGRYQTITYLNQYEKSVRKVTVTLPNRNKREFRYDFAGNLVYLSDVNSGEKQYFYDTHSNLRFVKNDVAARLGMCKYRLYDRVHRLIEEGLCPSLPDSELHEKTADPGYPYSGKIVSRRYVYDGDCGVNEIGRLGRIDIFGETDDDTVLSSVSVFAEKPDRIVHKTVSAGGAQYRTTTCYDHFGNVTGETDTDGVVTKYAYDSALRLKSVSRGDKVIAETTYRADSLPSRVVTCGNPIAYAYDARGKITGIDSPFYAEKITYLEEGKFYNGKLKSVETQIKSTQSTDQPLAIKYALDYDEGGRLLSARCDAAPAFSLTDIRYDGNGNIVSCIAGGKPTASVFEKGTDKVTAVGDATYEYDENGAVTRFTKGSATDIEYYPYSGLPRRMTGDGFVAEFQYDEGGKRLIKTLTIDGERHSNVYLYNDEKLSEEIRDGKSLKYLHGSAGIGVVSCNGVDYSVITDRLGYPKVVAECRKIIQAYHFKPFGEAVKVINESELVNILFGSYELDSETGLYYAKARLYDPGACRFLSPDPEWEFPSPYIFCGNDPFAVIDANGEASWYASLIGTVIGIVLTVGLSVLTMGASAPVATALFGAGGTTITAATSAVKTAAIVAYNVTATFAVSAVSGFSSTGIGHAIDGEPLTAPTAYDILFNSAVAGLVFGGAATLVSSVGKFVVGEADPLLMKARKYAAQGAILSLVNSGVSAAASPISDVMTGEPASGIGAAVSAGFGAISGMLTTFASAIAESNTLGITSDIKRELLNDTIWGGFDPGVYYGAIMDVVDSGSSEGTYDDFSVGTAHYIQSNKEAGPVGIKDEQITRAFACFSESNAFDGKPFTGSIRHASRNSTAPRYLATRGFGQKLA